MSVPLLAALGAVSATVGTVLAVPPGRRRLPDGTVDARAWAPTQRAGEPERGGLPLLRVVATVAVAVGVLFFLGVRIGVVAGAGAGLACWCLTGRLEPPAVRRRRQQLAAAVPHAVDLMAACLAAGLSPVSALEQIAVAVDEPLAAELGDPVARLRLGVDPVTVWRDLATHPQLGGLGRTVARAVDSGASVSEAMLRLADDLRRQSRARIEEKARQVGVLAALPLGVCLLPAFILVGVVPLVAGSVSVLLGP